MQSRGGLPENDRGTSTDLAFDEVDRHRCGGVVIRRRHGPRVAVVGGGVLGVSTAAPRAERGARVTLLSEAGLASGASGRSLSWLNSSGRRSPQYHRLRLLGLDRYLLALPLRRNQRLNDLSQPTEHQLLAPAPHGQTTPRESSKIHLRQL